MKIERAQRCDMTDVKEVPASNTRISGMLFGIANEDSCYQGKTHQKYRPKMSAPLVNMIKEGCEN